MQASRIFFGSLAAIAIALVACVSDSADSSCSTYCATINKACTGSNAQFTFQTGTMDPSQACLALCPLLPQTGQAVGNTLKCRANQLSLVDEAKGDPATLHARCMDAGPFSEICGGRIANFCKLDAVQCGTMAFGSEQACESAMAGVKPGLDQGVNDAPVPAVNTAVCRFYHLLKTVESAQTHCPHTRAPMSPVCVN